MRQRRVWGMADAGRAGKCGGRVSSGNGNPEGSAKEPRDNPLEHSFLAYRELDSF